jgi:hypothetical protein
VTALLERGMLQVRRRSWLWSSLYVGPVCGAAAEARQPVMAQLQQGVLQLGRQQEGVEQSSMSPAAAVLHLCLL